MPCFVRQAPTGRHANAPPPRGMRGSCQMCQHGGGEGVVAAAWLLRLGTGCCAVNHAAGLEEGGSSALSGLAPLRLPRSPGSPVPHLPKVRAGLAKRASALSGLAPVPHLPEVRAGLAKHASRPNIVHGNTHQSHTRIVRENVQQNIGGQMERCGNHEKGCKERCLTQDVGDQKERC